MKLLRVLGAMTLLALALLVAPSSATAAPGDPYGGPGNSQGGVTVSPPSGGGGGPVTVTVTGGKGDTKGCIVVRDSSGNKIDSACGALGRNGKVRFTVCVPAGTYTVHAYDQDGNSLGTSQFRSRGCGQGGPGHSTAGSLPSTGSNDAMTFGLIAGGVLLVGGAGFVVASRKRQTT